MKFFKVNQAVILYFRFVLPILIFFSNSYGQAVCDAKYIKISNIGGFIRVLDKDGKGILADFDVKLWRIEKDDSEDTLLQSTKSSESGRFSMPNVAKGKYRIEISDPNDLFIKIFANLKLRPQKADSDGNTTLLVQMGVEPLKPCGGGVIRAIKVRI